MKAVCPTHLIYLLIQVALLDMLWSFAHTSISEKSTTSVYIYSDCPICPVRNYGTSSSERIFHIWIKFRVQLDPSLLALWQ